ncbi:MAG: FAD-dependent oxidoreductase [Mesorhizobium sp.]
MVSAPDNPRTLTTTCCIAGGGPAGMMLGLLLARAGVDVLVLEKHADFLRDFRGDTIHPSTLEIMREVGLDERLLALPHQKIETLSVSIGKTQAMVGDFRHLPVTHPFIMQVPQWDFLDFLLGEARKLPTFRHMMQAQATDLVFDGPKVCGVRATTPEGVVEIAADLVVDASGRGSTLREHAGLELIDLGAPIDVFWFHLPLKPADTEQTGGRFDAGGLFVQIFRGTYWQCAYVIPKGSADQIRQQGIEAFRKRISDFDPFEPERAQALASFDDVKLLSVSVDRLKTWFAPGYLAIGDAAHAMSPVGGVGINLAVQDAVASANRLAAPLLAGRLSIADLEAVQRRREWPTRVIQRGQVFVHRNVLTPVLQAKRIDSPPLFVRLVKRFPVLARIPARILGLGIRPEHVATPAARFPHVKA